MKAGANQAPTIESPMQDMSDYSLTSEQIYRDELVFQFTEAHQLLKEGNTLVRLAEKGKEYPKYLKLDYHVDPRTRRTTPRFVVVDLATGNMLTTTNLTAEEIFADDWMIASLTKEKDVTTSC